MVILLKDQLTPEFLFISPNQRVPEHQRKIKSGFYTIFLIKYCSICRRFAFMAYFSNYYKLKIDR